MTRHQYLTLTMTLGLTLIGLSTPTFANTCEFDEIGLFATNSMRLGTGVLVTGNVVANNASPGPVLDEGVELALDRNAQIMGDASAVSVDLDNGASVSGTLTCDSGDAACTGLAPPVFAAGDLPVFLLADVRPDAEDVFVAAGTVEILGASALACSVSLTSCTVDTECDAGEACIPGRTTSYGDIVVDQGGTVVFAEGGRFDVRSITGLAAGGQCDPCRSIEFDAPTELRIEGRFDAERGAYVGPSAVSVIDASDVAVYVGGQNGATGGLFEVPRAASVGRESEVHASFYVPNGLFELERSSTMSGAVLAADVQIDKDSTFTGDSAFANKPPTADDKDAFTNGQASIAIGLTGSDPEGQVLTFVATQPGVGSVSVAGSTATYTNNAADAETSFTYTATDECDAVSAPATVRINPAGDPNTPPDEPTAVVVANDQLCASAVDPIDCSLETIEDTAITLILIATAPCEGGFPTLPDEPNDEQPCDGMGNDVPLTFSLPSTTTSQGGTLSGLNQGTGELQEPPGADEVPQRTASVLYTPPPPTMGVPFTGVDSFTFDVGGDVDGIGGIGGAGETDSATVEISVQTFTPVPPVEARDQEVTTEKDTPVDINLSGAAGTCDPNDPDCRKGLSGPARSKIGGPAISSSATAEEIAERLAYAGSSAVLKVPAFASKATSADLATAMDIGAALISSSSITGDANANAALSNLGVINPTQGNSFAVLSTGVVGAQAEPGIDFSPGGVSGDKTVLTLILDVAAGSGRVTFDFNFLSSEHPEYVNSGFNDTFTAKITDAAGERAIAAAFVDTTTLFDVTGTNAGGSGFDLFAVDPSGTDSVFVAEGSGLADAGLTGFQSASELFVSDGQITLEFSIEDIGDGVLDSAVILDNLALVVVEQSAFTILTLPPVGTLSYFDPLTGASTDITAGDLPLVLPTEEVTYTPPTGQTGNPLASFAYSISDGLTTDTGTIELVVTGEVIVVDSCLEVGRDLGCIPASLTGGSEPVEFVDSFDGPSDGLTFIVEGAGTVSSSRVPLAGNQILRGLVCTSHCTKAFPVGSVVKVFARPEPGGKFVGWSGACWGDDQTDHPSGTVQLGKQTVCKATFRAEEEIAE